MTISEVCLDKDVDLKNLLTAQSTTHCWKLKKLQLWTKSRSLSERWLLSITLIVEVIKTNSRSFKMLMKYCLTKRNVMFTINTEKRA